MEDEVNTHEGHGLEENPDIEDGTTDEAVAGRRREHPRQPRALPLVVGLGVLLLVAVLAFKAWVNDGGSGEAASATPAAGAPTCVAKPAPKPQVTNKGHRNRDRRPAPRPKQTPCLALHVESSAGGKNVEVVGYIGLGQGQPLRGARVQLLGGKARSQVEPTGDVLVSDGQGAVHFTVKSPVRAYALRFDDNGFYGSAASGVAAVPN